MPFRGRRRFFGPRRPWVRRFAPWARRRTATTPPRIPRPLAYVNASSGSGLALQRLNNFARTPAINGFPRRQDVVLSYQFTGQTNPGVVTSGDHTFRLNSVFDPDFSLGGHQPRGFDQFAAIYKYFRVRKVEAHIHVRQRAAHGIETFLIANNATTTLAATAVLGEYQDAIRMGITSSNVRPLEKKVTYWPHKVLGMTMAEYMANEDTGALVTANPVIDCCLHVVTNQVDAATVLDIEEDIILYYHVSFLDTVDVPIS